MHTKPPGGPFWQLVELFLILPLRLAARWVSLIDALVVAVAGSAARPFTVTGTQVPACTGSAMKATARAAKSAPATATLPRIMMPSRTVA